MAILAGSLHFQILFPSDRFFSGGPMVQSTTICYCSNARFGRSGVQLSSFKTWTTFALRRYFQSSGSEDSVPSRQPKELDPDPQANQKGHDERREEFQQLIERAYAEIVARRSNR
jgi:hypothetical protein